MKLQKLEVRLQREADRDWGGLWDLHLLQMRVTRLGMMWQPARSQPFPRGRGGGGGGGLKGAHFRRLEIARCADGRRWKQGNGILSFVTVSQHSGRTAH